MLALHEHVFDETITGTGSTWYSSTQHHALFGAADAFVVIAHATDVSGSSPALNVYFEESCDNQHWHSEASALIEGSLPTAGFIQSAPWPLNPSALAVLPFGRFRITLAGTSPRCRLKLTVTGRRF
jgi:hypothetical protein